MENKQIIGVYGVFGVGKSFLARGVSAHLLDWDVIATDNLLAIARKLTTDPYLEQSSYLAWTLLGENTPKNIIEGFRRYRNALQPYIKIILDRAEKQRVDMILEGVHISPEVLKQYKKRLKTKPVLVTIPDRTIHWARIEQKCADRPQLLERILPHFETARCLQEFLIEEAEDYCVPVVGNEGLAQESIQSLRRLLNVG